MAIVVVRTKKSLGIAVVFPHLGGRLFIHRRRNNSRTFQGGIHVRVTMCSMIAASP
jgi:hypothetical protein